MRDRWPLILVGLLTLVGLALRIDQYGQSLLGDELSTLWIVEGRSLADAIDLVAGDAEITPPLYFVFAWLASRLGSAPELVRLPALLAGTACIPLIYVLGLRTVGRIPGLLAAALFTLSPSMIFFSASGRSYTVMLLMLIGSTLAMLAAVRTGRVRWWVAYGLVSCLAIYSHYTALFVLLAQFLWLLWAEPAARRPALLANAGAAALFVPWLPSLLADQDSPTTELLESLQGDGFEVKRLALEQWAFGHPLLEISELPGRFVVLVIASALLVAAAAALVRLLGGRRRIDLREPHRRMAVLVFAIALATPVALGLYSLTGSDLLGSRNLVASWPGLALGIGTVLAAAGPVWGGTCALAVLGGFTVGAAKCLEDSARTIDYRSAAAAIEQRRAPVDAVVDLLSPPVTPAPLTPLAAHLGRGPEPYSLNLPAGDPPFLPLTPIPDPDLLLNRALAAGRDGTVFIVGPGARVTVGPSGRGRYVDGDIELPAGWRVDSIRSYPGVAELSLYEVSRRGAP